MGENKLPLKGIRVVDFSEFVAAPVVAKLLADWGADVVKVERFEGDVWRWYGPSFKMPCQPDENPLFDIEHLKKKFIALNLKTDEGKEIMDRLLSKADVFVTSYRADALEKLGLSYEELSAKYPRLIYAHLQGFGEKGPEADRPGFDVVCYWARSGAMLDLVPGECGVPITAPFGFGDHITGATLTGGVCAALYSREKTGRGDKVYISLFASAIFGTGCMITSTQEKYGDSFPRYRTRPNNAVGHTYKCKDGRWLLLSILDYARYWPILCEKVFGLPELAKDERFNTKLKAVQNSLEMYKILEETFMSRTSEEWAPLLLENDIAFEKIQHYSDVTKDPQAWANGFVFEHTFKSGNTGILPRTPVQFASFEVEPPPAGYGTRIGENTNEVLLDLGYSAGDVEEMVKKNAIKQA